MDHFPLERQERAFVFVLYSIHNVMKAEKVLKSRGVLFDTIPVPKDISADCGMAILVASEDREEVRNILGKNGINIKGMYLKTRGRYEKEND